MLNMDCYSELVKEIFLRNIWTFAHLKKIYSNAIEDIDLEIATDGYTPTLNQTLKLQLVMAKSAKKYLDTIIKIIEDRLVFEYKTERCPEEAKEMLAIVRGRDVKGGFSKEIGCVVSLFKIKYCQRYETMMLKNAVSNYDKKIASEIIDGILEYLFNEEQFLLKEDFSKFNTIYKNKKKINKLKFEQSYYEVAGKIEAINNYNFHLREILTKSGFIYKNRISISRYIECINNLKEKKQIKNNLEMMN